MRGRVRAKWRPPLTLVLAGPLAAVFLLPLLGIGYFRIAGGILGWRETIFVIGWMGLMAALILGFLLWRLVLRPVRDMTRYAESVTSGDAGPDLPEHYGTPEFSRLGQSMADMARVLQGREAVVRSYADHVTHELRSPITAIQGAAELLDDPDLPAPQREKLLANIGQATKRMSALLAAQQTFARAADPDQPGQARLSDCLTDLPVDLVQDVRVALPAPVVRVTLEHLVGNALAHGATQVTLTGQPDGFTLHDNGPGISAGNRARIFDPFFTTRRDAGGTGMGLAIVRRMLEAQGAEITLENGEGAVFRVRV